VGVLRNACKIVVGKPERKRPLEKRIVGVDGRILLKWIFNKWGVKILVSTDLA
jgi:hypothetical protein